MGGFYCGLVIQTFVVCEQHPSWKSLTLPQCPLGKEVAIAQLVSELDCSAPMCFASANLPLADILSDTMLIAAPGTTMPRINCFTRIVLIQDT